MHIPVLALAALLAPVSAQDGPSDATRAQKPLKVFILAGQSNMEGKAKLTLAEYQSEAPETKEWYRDLKPDGAWVVRPDVWIEFLGRRGDLTVGFGSPGCIGPELAFGMTIDDHFDQQVLLIKTAWGGRSLGRDFLPPSAPLPNDEAIAEIVERENVGNRERERPEVNADDVRARYGSTYRDMIREVRAVLGELGDRFPGYRGQGYEIAGLVWFQGWNDMFDESFVANYGDNLANLVRDLRREFECPELPVVIGLMGQNGFEPAKGSMARIKSAQLAIAETKEFKGTVRSVPTDVYWDAAAAAKIDRWQDHVAEWEKVGSDRGYHYLGSVRTFCGIGRAFGEAMIGLLDPR